MAKALTILVAISLVAATIFLALFFNGLGTSAIIGEGELTAEPGIPIDPQLPGGFIVTADDLRELALALAAVITAITGLLGLIATQVWRGREENRVASTHRLTLERERLELERERLQLDKERLDFERQKNEIGGAK
jgi:hypothetical protein